MHFVVIDTCHRTLGDLGCMALIVKGVEFVPIQVKGMSELVILVNLGFTINNFNGCSHCLK